MSAFLGIQAGDLGTDNAIPPLAYPGEPSSYGIDAPPRAASVSVDDFFRYTYRASSVRVQIGLSWRDEEDTEFTATASKIVPRYQYAFIDPPEDDENPKPFSITQNILVGERGEAPVVFTKVNVRIAPSDQEPFFVENTLGITLLNTRGGLPIQYFLSSSGFYSFPFMEVSLAPFVGISGTFLGSQFRSYLRQDGAQDVSGSVSVDFAGGDLPLL